MPAQRVRIIEGCKFVIPAPHGREISIVAGDTVLVDIEGGEMQMRLLSQMVARAQPILRRHVPDDISLADKLIADRRREEEPG